MTTREHGDVASKPIRLTVDGERFAGPAIDLRDRSIERDALVAAIRGAPSPYAVDCPTPGSVHERAGVVDPDVGLKTRTALAAAARSRGVDTAHDDRIDRLADDLAALSEPVEDRSPAEGPPPEAVARLRERTAELRGQVTALESAGADATDARATLREAAARLSELETRRIAAEQTRERTREYRDRRERRLGLEDRLANARRDARAALVERVREEYVAAVETLRGNRVDDPFDGPAPVAALAVLRVAAVRAPVVIAGDLSRSEAKELTDAGAAEFALATYVATHDPLPEARAAAEGALDVAAGEPRDGLSDTMSDVDDLL